MNNFKVSFNFAILYFMVTQKHNENNIVRLDIFDLNFEGGGPKNTKQIEMSQHNYLRPS